MKKVTRSQAWAMWHRLSRGDADAETLAWLARVAKEVVAVEQEVTDPNARRLALVKAIGLDGRVNFEHDAIRALARTLPRATQSERQTFTDAVRATLMQPIDPVRGLDLEAIDKRIRRALKEK